MPLNRLYAPLGAIILGFSAACWAQDATTVPTTTPASTEAASLPTSAPATCAASDTDSIKKLAGKDAAITGKVDRISATSSGSITFIDFDGNQRGDFVAIIKEANLDALNKAFDGDLSKAITGKKITVTGKVSLFRGGPQIEVLKPEQVTIVKE